MPENLLVYLLSFFSQHLKVSDRRIDNLFYPHF